MLKVSGALLVFFAGWGMGNWRSRQYQQRIKDLQILQLIISCLIGEISYARNTLPEAFSRISEKVASPFREYLQSVAKRLKEQTGETFVRILKEQEQTVREKTSLREEDWDLFLRPSGILDIWMQRCRYSFLRAERQTCNAGRKTAASAAGTEKSVAKPRDPGGSFSGGDPYLRREAVVEVGIIFKIGAVGILVSVLSLVLKHSGREDQAFLTSLAGLVLVLFWVLPYIYDLFETVKKLFAL